MFHLLLLLIALAFISILFNMECRELKGESFVIKEYRDLLNDIDIYATELLLKEDNKSLEHITNKIIDKLKIKKDKYIALIDYDISEESLRLTIACRVKEIMKDAEEENDK